MQITIDLITKRREIYDALRESEENDCILGISSPDLGPGMFMTSVREIIHDGDEIFIVLNSYDSTGYFFEKNRISLDNVTGVLPFKTVFGNPFLKKLQTNGDGPTDGTNDSPDYVL